MRRINFPERWGNFTKPSSLSRRSTPGRGSARGLIDLCVRSVAILPLAEPVRDVLGMVRKELAPR
eukprot:306293-Pyramimonas_sp.AAC.1